jgi:E3 ubiquitin-protein ligase HUWE1
VLLTSSEAVLSALPSPLLAEAQMLRDRAMSHYQARSLFGSSHRLNSRRNGLGFDRQTVMDRGVGVTIGQRAASAFADGMKMNEIEGEPLLDTNALKALIHLLRMAQVIGDLCILCFTGKQSCILAIWGMNIYFVLVLLIWQNGLELFDM